MVLPNLPGDVAAWLSCTTATHNRCAPRGTLEYPLVFIVEPEPRWFQVKVEAHCALRIAHAFFLRIAHCASRNAPMSDARFFFSTNTCTPHVIYFPCLIFK